MESGEANILLLTDDTTTTCSRGFVIFLPLRTASGMDGSHPASIAQRTHCLVA